MAQLLQEKIAGAGVTPVVNLDLQADGSYIEAAAGGGGGDATAANQTSQITIETAIRDAVQIMDDWDETDRAKVNIIAGQAGVAGGSGAVSAATQRTVLAADVALPAGTNILGKVGIDQATPGSTNGVQQKQYAGVPSSFTIGTTDQTVFTLATSEIGFIQNLDDAALAVKKGASATISSFSFILPAGTAQDDGKGGAICIDDWVGVVSVAAMSGSPRYISWKQAAA